MSNNVEYFRKYYVTQIFAQPSKPHPAQVLAENTLNYQLGSIWSISHYLDERSNVYLILEYIKCHLEIDASSRPGEPKDYISLTIKRLCPSVSGPAQ